MTRCAACPPPGLPSSRVGPAAPESATAAGPLAGGRIDQLESAHADSPTQSSPPHYDRVEGTVRHSRREARRSAIAVLRDLSRVGTIPAQHRERAGRERIARERRLSPRRDRPPQRLLHSHSTLLCSSPRPVVQRRCPGAGSAHAERGGAPRRLRSSYPCQRAVSIQSLRRSRHRPADRRRSSVEGVGTRSRVGSLSLPSRLPAPLSFARRCVGPDTAR